MTAPLSLYLHFFFLFIIFHHTLYHYSSLAFFYHIVIVLSFVPSFFLLSLVHLLSFCVAVYGSICLTPFLSFAFFYSGTASLLLCWNLFHYIPLCSSYCTVTFTYTTQPQQCSCHPFIPGLKGICLTEPS